MNVAEMIPEQEVWLHLAAAEVDSPRHGSFYTSVIGSKAVARLRALPVPYWTDDDQRAARAAVWARRSMFVAPLLATGPHWRTGTLRTDELADVRVINHPGFRALAPNRRLGELVRAVDAGREVPGDDFASGYRAIRARFDPSRMRGLPILVGEGFSGPFTEVEGLTRLSCLHSKYLAKESVPAEVRVVLGASPRVHDWKWY